MPRVGIDQKITERRFRHSRGRILPRKSQRQLESKRFLARIDGQSKKVMVVCQEKNENRRLKYNSDAVAAPFQDLS